MSFTFMSAPMEDISDNAFRTLCHRYGADVTFTEMVRIEALARKNASTWSRLNFNDNTPTIIQLLGADEYYLKKFLSMFKPHDGFQGFNLNLGCPSPHVVKLGQGCAMIKRIAKTQKLVDIIKKDKINKNNPDYNISIKIRLGLNQFEKERKVYLNLIKVVSADFFVVHARYGSQTYLDKPDYNVFPECVETADKTGKAIIANGDIDTKEKIEELKKMGVKGAMIGRAAVHNPAIFNILKENAKISSISQFNIPKCINIPTISQLKEDYLKLAEQFNAPFKYRKNVLKHLGNKKIMAIIDG